MKIVKIPYATDYKNLKFHRPSPIFYNPGGTPTREFGKINLRAIWVMSELDSKGHKVLEGAKSTTHASRIHNSADMAVLLTRKTFLIRFTIFNTGSNIALIFYKSWNCFYFMSVWVNL